MNAGIRHKLEMAARVREFTRARAATEPRYLASLERLDALLERAAAIAQRQHMGLVMARAARTAREEERHRLHAELLHHLVTVGAIAAQSSADLAGMFRLPATNANTAEYLVAIRSLRTAAEAMREDLIAAGLHPDWFGDFDRAILAIEAAREEQRTARRDHMAATLELQTVTAELREQIELIDASTRYFFGYDSDVMDMWRAIRRLPAARSTLTQRERPHRAIAAHDHVLLPVHGVRLGVIDGADANVADRGRLLLAAQVQDRDLRHHPAQDVRLRECQEAEQGGEDDTVPERGTQHPAFFTDEADGGDTDRDVLR